MCNIEVRTQAEFDAAISRGDKAICIAGSFRLVTSGGDAPKIEVRAGVSLYVVARGSSQPHVVARESSQPHVEAWGSSQPRVVARESSQPRVVARESSQPHVEARGYVQVSLFGKVLARATANVAVLIRGNDPQVEGGIQTRFHIDTPQAWCDYYGVAVEDGVATLYKALDENFKSLHGMNYAPGTIPVAPDWDDGKRECGGGLHFSPTPAMALEFNEGAGKFVGCPVALSEIAIHPDGEMPQKVKARGCCKPCFEVDLKGNRIAPVKEVA